MSLLESSPKPLLHRRVGSEELDAAVDARIEKAPPSDDTSRRVNLRIYGIGASLVAVVLIAALAYARITDFVRGEANDAIISLLQRGGVETIDEGFSMIRALESDAQRRDILEDRRTRDAVVEHIAQGNGNSIRKGLNLIRPFANEWQQDIRDDPRARDAIIGYYEQRIVDAFNPGEGRYDYGTANEQIQALDSLYPDSATVLTMGNELEAHRDAELGRLTRAYDELLDELQSSAVNEQGFGDVLQAIRLLDPEHPTLEDPRLGHAFAGQARAAMDAGDLMKAKTIMDLAGELIPGDRSLVQLRRQLAARLERERRDHLAMQLRARLEGERGSLNTLADFRRVQDDLMMLESLRPRDSMLKDLRWQLQQIFLSGFDELMAKQRWQKAQGLLVDFARFFDIHYVATQRARLSKAEKAHDFQVPATQSRRSRLAARTGTINELLKQPVLTPEWEAKFETAFKEALAMVGADGSGVRVVSRAMMLLYRDRAVEAVTAKRYVQARNLVAKGRAYMPDAAELDEVERMLVDAQQTVLGKQEYERRSGRTEIRPLRELG